MTKRLFPIKETGDRHVNRTIWKPRRLLILAAMIFLVLLICHALYPLALEAKPAKEDLILFSFDTKLYEDVEEIPNTCEECVLERKSHVPERLYLVTLNDGQLHSLEMQEMYEPCKDNFGYMSIQLGRDEFSSMGITVISNPDHKELSANISKGNGGLSILQAKSHFCDRCVKEMLAVTEGSLMVNAVLLDDETQTFYGIGDGEHLQVGDCAVSISQEQNGYDIVIQVEYGHE